MPTSFEVIFLGSLPLIDTTQGNETAENAAGILGTYGTAANPLHNSVQFLTAEQLSEDANDTYDTDNGGGFDSFRINGGTAQNFDAVAIYNAVITYVDGTTATITATVFQDVLGNTYLAPEETNNADQIALTAAPILSLSLDSVVTASGDMVADRVAGDFGTAVDGTAGDDAMFLGYTDAQGDQITTGDDYILGGDGNDNINASAGNDTVLGGSGDDVIDEWAGDDLVFAGSGADRVELSIGNDTVFMEDGDDTVTLWDNAGNKSLDGGSGNDLLNFQNWQSSTGATVTIGPDGSGSFSHFSGATTGTFTGFETISGTAFDDQMVASTNTTGINLSGEGGNDLLIGGSGQDQIDGGAGTDTLVGNGGSDSIIGGDGADRIYGDNTAAGPVTVNNGDFGTNTIEGWATSGGGNTYVYSQAMAFNASNTGFGGVAQQTVAVQVGVSYQLSFDAFEFGSGSGNHTLVAEVLDTAGQVIGSQTVVVNDGTSQTVTLDFTALTPNVTLRFTNPTSTSTDTTDLKIDNVTVTTLTPVVDGDDTIDAGEGDDFVDAGGGNDSVSGGGGNDIVFADEGNDTVDGGVGNDTIYGGGGGDSITGGDGNDSIFGDNATPAPVTVTNGDFATGTTAGWTVTGAGTAVDGGALAFNSANSGFGGTAQQTVATQIGFDYQLSFTARENGGGSADHTLVVEVIDANGQVIGAQTITVANGSSQVVTVGFTATTADTTLRFSNPTSTGTSSTDVQIDDVTVTALPTPTTTGNDTINAGEGSDFVDAGGGDDLVIVDGSFSGEDTLDGGAGDDTLVLDPDNNRNLNVNMVTGAVSDGGQGGQAFTNFENVVTADGNDSVTGTTGANLISTQGGNDTVLGGGGNDTILGGAGADRLDGGDGDDSLVGGDGNDTLIAGNNTGAGDQLFGGAGNDYLVDSFWNATLDGGTGSDIFELGYGSATVIGGEDVGDADSDLIDFRPANDAVNIVYTGDESGTYTDSDGDSGQFSQIEAIILTDQADTVDASADTSGVVLIGNGGADLLTGGQGDDFLTGDDGSDVIAGGRGNDSLTGGAGDDVFTYVSGDGLDTITDFNTGNSGALRDGDTTNNDFIDLSSFYDNLRELWADQRDDGILNQSNTTDTQGNAVDYSDNARFETDATPGNEGIFFANTSGESSFFSTDNTGVVCFAAGTLIATPRGEIAVEDLRAGDLVLTVDAGAQAIVWKGSVARDWSPDHHSDKPIVIKAGSLGQGLPFRDLRVSPQHRVLLSDAEDPAGVFVPAKGLLVLPGVRQMAGCRSVVYHHIMLERHQLLISNGMPTESLYPGEMALRMMAPAHSGAVLRILMSVTQGGGLGRYPLARKSLSLRSARNALRSGYAAAKRSAGPPCARFQGAAGYGEVARSPGHRPADVPRSDVRAWLLPAPPRQLPFRTDAEDPHRVLDGLTR